MNELVMYHPLFNELEVADSLDSLWYAIKNGWIIIGEL